jgi:hypothetical protein
MEQSPSWEANLQLVKRFPAFLEPEGSSPHPQAQATLPYPEPTPTFNISNIDKKINKELPEDDLLEDRNMLECFLKCFK